jgi:exopolysaccharide biosynthesis polyprenyl glycosylphosphotransferase
MASKPNLQAHLGTVAELSSDKKKPHAVGASVLPVTGNQQVWIDVRPRSSLARSAGPLAIPTLSGGRWVQVAYAIADLSCIVLTFAVVLMARYAANWKLYSVSGFVNLLRTVIPEGYIGVLLLYAALIVLFSQLHGLYHTPRDRSQLQETFLVAKALSWSTAMLMATIYLSGSRTISRLVILASAVMNLAVLASWRMWKRSIIERRVAAGIGIRNVLIVGAGKIGNELAEYFDTNRHLGVVVKGFLHDNHAKGPRVLGRIEDLPQVCRAHFVDEVIITMPFMHSQVRRAVIQARLNNLDVKIVPDLYGSSARGATLEHLGHVPVMSLGAQPIPVFGMILKRAIDVIGSAIGLALFSPVALAIAVAIKLDSAGPVHYQAWRVGKKGQRFVCYKFRTMLQNADALKDSLRHLNQRQGATFKIGDDPRITRVGRFLRKYSLDELPQLWNVFKGEMSLVGPRPHPVDDYQQYDLEHLRRLDVTPGVTGLWQVTARRDPSFEKNMALDLEYIAQWNLWMDLRILCQTMRVVVMGNGT